MKTVPDQWILWDTKEPLPYSGGVSFSIRTVQPIFCTDEMGLPLAFGTGEQEVHVSGDGVIHFECESEIWLRPSSRVQKRLQMSSVIFTTTDRPAPLTPEMAAIHRMMRKNEIDRQRDRDDMEKRLAYREKRAVEKTTETTASEVSAPAPKTVRKKPVRSGSDTEKQGKPEPGKDAEGDVLPEPVNGDEPDSPSDK